MTLVSNNSNSSNDELHYSAMRSFGKKEACFNNSCFIMRQGGRVILNTKIDCVPELHISDAQRSKSIFNRGINFSIYNFGSTEFNFPLDMNIEETASDISKVDNKYAKECKVKELELPNGLKVLVNKYNYWDKSQPQWDDLQKYMIQAANMYGLTIVYSEVCRTVSTSNASREQKGSCVAPGGKSPHNYGVAADIWVFKDGELVSNNTDLYRKFVDKAIELSGGRIKWGGYYKDRALAVQERHHFEIDGWNDINSPNYCKNKEYKITSLKK